MRQTTRHRKIGMGGTFDHFHAGHQHFIEFAATLGDELLIGVVNQSLTIGKPLNELIQPFSTRKHAVINFCNKNRIRAKVVELKDPYGPAISQEKEDRIDALCVTDATLEGAKTINHIRQKLSLRPLQVYVCPLKKDESGEVISSTSIRQGLVNRKGQLYSSVWGEDDFLLNETQRQYFHKPQGDLVTAPTEDVHTGAKICVVGDSSLHQFLKNQWYFDLGIYDLYQQRQAVTYPELLELEPHLTVTNPAGYVTQALRDSLKKALEKSLQLLKVDGEEDLAVLPLVLSLPLHSVIYYGQPNDGLVELTVSEVLKEHFFEVLHT